jgi:hypothetical protein
MTFITAVLLPFVTYFPTLPRSPTILDGDTNGQWLYSWPGRFIPEERDPRNQWTGGWVGFRAGLDAME